MRSFAALLRAVNVGGRGKLPVAELVLLCEQAGFSSVRTYIASGNAIFDSDGDEAAIKAALEDRLRAHCGAPVDVAVRDAAALSRTVGDNPFPEASPSSVLVTFLDRQTSPTMLAGVTGQTADERIALGLREIYVHYGAGVGRSKLRFPTAARGTARNINTVTTLASMTASRAGSRSG